MITKTKIRQSMSEITRLDAESMIERWQRKLNLQHWRIELSEKEPIEKSHLMTIHMVRTRSIAEVRIKKSCFLLPPEKFEPLIVHELTHILVENIIEEHDFQMAYLGDSQINKIDEYKERLRREIEKSVEHVAVVLHNNCKRL